MGKLPSLMIKPVINLVIEAIGKTAWSFLLSKTSLVSWSITYATLDFRSKKSFVACKPAFCPKDGITGAALTAWRRICAFTTAGLDFWTLVFFCVLLACACTVHKEVNKPSERAISSRFKRGSFGLKT